MPKVIITKTFNMPTQCVDCPCYCDGSMYGPTTCEATGRTLPDGIKHTIYQKCPLKENETIYINYKKIKYEWKRETES